MFLKLTRHDGQRIAVNSDHISALTYRTDEPGAILSMDYNLSMGRADSDRIIVVKETFSEVADRLIGGSSNE